MPVLLHGKGFKFFFYSNENSEPCHVHVKKGSGSGKVWLMPALRIEFMDGFTKAEEKDVINIILKEFEFFKKKWNEYFK